MTKYRKKPVVIDAFQFTPLNCEDVANWCGGRYVEETKAGDPTDVYRALKIPTLEGVMTAALGDWIIRGVHGEFYPCKPDIFEQTYEKVDNDD
jgi:hypothetical protein